MATSTAMRDHVFTRLMNGFVDSIALICVCRAVGAARGSGR
jgi:hypothetical protein